MKIAFLGLGVMGYPMAGHLTSCKLKDKHPSLKVSVFNRGRDRAIAWGKQYDGIVVSTSVKCVNDADIIFCCLGRDEDVIELMLNTRVLSAIKTGALVVDHTTTSFNLAVRFESELAERGVNFIDAPVSGGSIGAEQGSLSIMAGGSASDLVRGLPFMNAYAKKITHMGAVGSGQTTKMVNQICITGILKGLSEGLKFAEAENLNIDKLLNAIGGGAAQSWQLDNRLATMSKREFDFGFAIKWMLKDLSYCLTRAERNNTDLQLVKQVYEEYLALAKNGHSDKDTSSLILNSD